MTLMNQFFCVKLTTNSELVLCAINQEHTARVATSVALFQNEQVYSFCIHPTTNSPNSLIQFSNDSNESNILNLFLP